MTETKNEPVENEIQEKKDIKEKELKTFTQDEVNALISESLASEKAKYESMLAEKEQRIKETELILRAKEMLLDSNIPVELLDILKFSDDTTLENAISLMKKHFKDNSKNGFIKVGATVDGETESESDMFSKAMGIIRRD